MARVAGIVTGDVTSLIQLASSSLSSLGGDGARFVDNAAIYCIWNDHSSRDEVAKIYGTYTNCRFSRVGFF